jgi:hypothetical protein
MFVGFYILLVWQQAGLKDRFLACRQPKKAKGAILERIEPV